jgi:tetratricopeptide (TPR) repeat protein
MLEWHLNNFEQILAPAEASLALAVEVSDKRDSAIAKYFLAGALLARDEDNDPARCLLEQSFAEFQELNEPFWQARVFITLGYFLATPAKPNYDDLLLRSIQLARKAEERLTLADALSEYADWLFRNNHVNEAEKYVEESEMLYKLIGSENTSFNPFLFAEISWSRGDYQKAKSIYLELEQRFSLLGHESFKSGCSGKLGILAMEQGDLNLAREYLEEALAFERAAGWKSWTAFYLAELSNLLYQQGKLEEFKQNLRESISLKNYLRNYHKATLLMVTLGWLYFQEAKSSAYVMGVVHNYERESEFPDFPLKPLEKRYWDRAETYTRKTIGDAAFESAFDEGQKMSLDEALDMVLKTVEEM